MRIPIVGVVGPCASGKSTLIQGLAQMGIPARHIAQEHSYVQTMWKRITNPDILIFLDASYEATIARRNLNWTVDEYLEQQRRLANARECCNFYLFTDSMTPVQVLEQVKSFLFQNEYPMKDRIFNAQLGEY